MIRHQMALMFSCVFALVLTTGAGCGVATSPGTDATPGIDAGPDGTVPDPPNTDIYAVVSSGPYRAPPPPSCEGEFIDYDCDAIIPLQCGPGAHIDYDSDVVCPVCAQDGADDPTTCDGWQDRYGDFLHHLIRESCANWCETDSDCFAWEIDNACGSYALSLTGAIDEEPIYFAGEFAEHNCGVCGAVEQTVFLRRPGSDVIEGDGQHSGLLTSFQSECWAHQCVLTPVE